MTVDRKALMTERRNLHQVFSTASEQISSSFGKRILSTSDTDVKVARQVKNLYGDARRTVNSAVDSVVQNRMNSMREVLAKAEFPGMTDKELEKLQNKVMKNLNGSFKGATLAQRMKVAEGMTQNRMGQEIASATSERASQIAKGRVSGYLTNSVADGIYLQGGSAYRYLDRILTSEMARAEQEATKSFLNETGLLGRWCLSPNHKKYDICDKLAEGTGIRASALISKAEEYINPEGVYTSEEMPVYPHPFCQCQIEPIYQEVMPLRITVRQAMQRAGEDMVNYGGGYISEDSQAYIRRWMSSEYKNVLPMETLEGRSREEAAKFAKRIEKQTASALDGTFSFKNKPLEKYIQTGGSRAYEELAKNLTGKYLDPSIVKEIGLDNAIKLLAQEIKATGNSDIVIESLKHYMERDMKIAMTRSIRRAEELMKEANGYRIQVLQGTPKRAVTGLRAKALQSARTELGDAVGYSEMHERLLRELTTSKEMSFLNVPLTSKVRGESLASTLGLKRSEYNVIRSGGKNWLVIDDRGMQRFSGVYDTEKRLSLSARLQRIRDGRENRKGWIPASFKPEIMDKSTGRMIKFELRPDQQTGIRFAKENKSALFHYKPGAGKTHTAIGTATELMAEGKVKKVLIVTPGNLSQQFDDEIKEIVVDIKSRNLANSARQVRMNAYAKDKPGFTVISHTQLEHDMEAIKAGGYDMVVIDEVHLVKPEVMTMAQDLPAQYRVAMTGTAIKDSITDMYSSLDWLKPGILPSRTQFDARFKDIVHASTLYEKSVLRDLKDTLNPLVITRDSPVKAKMIRRTLTVDLSEGQKVSAAKAEREAIEARVSGKKSKTEADAIRDRKLGKIVNAGDPETNNKFKALNEVVSRHPDEKVLVFVSDKDGFKTIQAGLGEDGALFYDSSMSRAKRNQIIREFRENPDAKMLVLTDAGAIGLNLEVSNVAVHWDLPSKAFKLEQREARNWRGMKTDTVYGYFLRSQTTYDARIAKELEVSRKIAESAKLAENLDEVGVAKTLKKLTRVNSVSYNMLPDDMSGGNILNKVVTKVEVGKPKFNPTPLNDSRLTRAVNLQGVHESFKPKVMTAVSRVDGDFPFVFDGMMKVNIGDLGDGNTLARMKMSIDGIGRMELNEHYFSDMVKLTSSHSSSVRSGWHPPGTSDIGSIVAHEMGHAVNDLLKLGLDDIDLKEFDALIDRYFKTENLAEKLSKYGTKNKGEMISEAFAEYYYSDNPRQLSRDIVNTLKTYAERWMPPID